VPRPFSGHPSWRYMVAIRRDTHCDLRGFRGYHADTAASRSAIISLSGTTCLNPAHRWDSLIRDRSPACTHRDRACGIADAARPSASQF